MKETEMGWESLTERAKHKIILCEDRDDGRDWMWNLFSAFQRDDTYAFNHRALNYEVQVLDKILGIPYVIKVISVNQWSWSNKVRGLDYDEVILTAKAGWNMEYPEDLSSVFAGCRVASGVSAMALLLLTNNDTMARRKLRAEVAESSAEVIVGNQNLAADFYFPLSLLRRGMFQYFEDQAAPTREEFLMALMMEDVSGTTEKEREAIEAARLYVQNKGYQADPNLSQ